MLRAGGLTPCGASGEHTGGLHPDALREKGTDDADYDQHPESDHDVEHQVDCYGVVDPMEGSLETLVIVGTRELVHGASLRSRN